jgi:hypothetical protein
MDLIPSLHAPHQIEARGFDKADRFAHMIGWLGRGADFRQFVTKDIETEIYSQTPGAQVRAVVCKEEPVCRTSVKQQEAGQPGIVTDVSVTFPMALEVRSDDAALWGLDVNLSYVAANIHLTDQRRTLRLDFVILAHRRIMQHAE